MDREAIRSYLNTKIGAVEEYPFGPEALVIKVAGKMFALLSEGEDPASVSLKCDPIDAQFLRDQYTAIKPGYHLNKQHWNTVTLDGSVPAEVLCRMADESYRLVVQGLPRRLRAGLLDAG